MLHKQLFYEFIDDGIYYRSANGLKLRTVSDSLSNYEGQLYGK